MSSFVPSDLPSAFQRECRNAETGVNRFEAKYDGQAVTVDGFPFNPILPLARFYIHFRFVVNLASSKDGHSILNVKTIGSQLIPKMAPENNLAVT
jgi:hypothetical protein